MSAVPNQRTWSPGELANAAMLNSNVRDPITFYKNPPCFFGYRINNALTVSNDVWTGIDFVGGTVIDTDNGYPGSGFQVTIKQSGVYDLRALVLFAGSSAGNRAAKIERVVGASTTVLIEAGLPSSGSDPAGTSGTGSPIVDTAVRLGDPGVALNSGDKLQFYVKQNSGGSLTVNGAASDYLSWFCALWVAA